MERAFIFDKFNTWHDWKLVLTSKSIPYPTPNENYIKLDGMSGSLDLSEALTGEITYSDRTISASFWTDYGNRNERVERFKEIRSELHGRKVAIIEPDDPTHYFLGRIKIKESKHLLAYSELVIEATCEPWRYAVVDCEKHIDVDSEKIVIIRNYGDKTLLPEIAVTGEVNVTFNGSTLTLDEGEYRIAGLRLKRGSNVIGLTGNGSITFAYREAVL